MEIATARAVEKTREIAERTLQKKIKVAESRGFLRGYRGYHTEPITYRDGACYIAWYRGWKRGAALRHEEAQSQ